jgi:uncharacterized Zn finger protein
MTNEQKSRDGNWAYENTGNNPASSNRGGGANAGRNTGDFFGTTLKSVYEGISSARSGDKTGVSVLEAVTSVVRPVVRDSHAPGASVVEGSKAIVLGVLKGTGEKDKAALKTLSHTVRTVIRETAHLNGDVAGAASGLVLGAIESTHLTGVDASSAVSAVSRAAMEEADQIGASAAEKVRETLKKKEIGGVRIPTPGPNQG